MLLVTHAVATWHIAAAAAATSSLPPLDMGGITVVLVVQRLIKPLLHLVNHLPRAGLVGTCIRC